MSEDIFEKAEKKARATAWEVLRLKFPESEYVLIEEVSDASGHARSRSLDYMLVNLWNSRGLAITGIEKKSNRGDWLKELKNPAKQETHFKYCDYFYLLTDKDNVAKLEEIPPNWGWYHINGSGILKTMKAAPKLEPIPVTRSFLCAMLRRAACKEKYVHVDDLEETIQKKAEGIQGNRNYELEQDAKGYKILKEKVEMFESASGLKIQQGWDESYPTKIGEAAKVVMNNGIDGHLHNLERVQRSIQQISDAISKSIETLKA